MSTPKRSPKAPSKAKTGAKRSSSVPKRPPALAGPRKGRVQALGGSPLGGGRGLGALIPGGHGQGKLIEVTLDSVQPDPKQPRKRFKRSALEELAASIQAQGILQPIIVSPLAQRRYRIIAGERRWRAAKLAGLKTIPVISRDVSEQEAFELALLENIQRVDLTPLEEALSYHRLVEEFELSHEQVAERTGKSRSTVSNALRLLKLPAEVITLLDEGALSAGHGRALLGLEHEAQLISVAHQTVAQGWSVRALERRVKEIQTATPPAPPSDPTRQIEGWVSDFTAGLTQVLAHDASDSPLSQQLRRQHLEVNVSAQPQGGAQLKIKVHDPQAAQALLRLFTGQ